ncbi:MAG: hypothetical protein EBY17_04770 [Acidobacteriia bacterium]|nr:hypothetical protein [Terriglobia bacterium]
MAIPGRDPTGLPLNRARVEFLAKRIYIKAFLTHAEYDRRGWMKWL